MSHALALHRGIMARPRGPTRLDARENAFTQAARRVVVVSTAWVQLGWLKADLIASLQATHYRLRTVSMKRKIFSSLLLMYRLVAAGFLLYVGTAFLSYTLSITELILNAVALSIILEIDDLLFDALATTPGRHLVEQLDPLPMPSLPRLRGADVKSVSWQRLHSLHSHQMSRGCTVSVVLVRSS